MGSLMVNYSVRRNRFKRPFTLQMRPFNARDVEYLPACSAPDRDDRR